jgi:molybdate transport system ATP-binding protein
MTLEVSLRHEFTAFALDAEFTCGPGITALFGPSGAGKTTVLRAIAGLFKLRDGRIVLDERVLTDTASHIALAPHARKLGVVFQEPRLFPHLSVEGNLRFGWQRARPRLSEADVAELIASLELEPLLHRGPSKLSGGERQRVAIGRALLASPSLLLLDEPLAGLDRPLKEEILPYLERLRDEARVPILYVSHAIDEVIRLADEVVVMAAGRVIAHGNVFEVFARSELGPLVGDQAGAVIAATVKAHHGADQLSELDFAGHRLLVPLIAVPIGLNVRLRILARDITLALDRPSRISANNILPAAVVEAAPGHGGQASITLDCSGARLLAEITRASAARLGLAPGTPVYAIIKSVTLDLRPVAPPPPHGADPGR